MNDNIPAIIESATPASFAPYRSRRGATIEAVIGAWLNAIKSKRSRSERTQEAYRETIDAFRSFLQKNHLDLLSDEPDFVHFVADAAQIFMSLRSDKANRSGEVAAATQCQRLSILSSFYRYAIGRGHLPLGLGNPIDLVDRPTVRAYEQAKAISKEEIQLRLQAIDVNTPKGLRDMALLLILFTTGRRYAEVAKMQRKDIERVGKLYIVTFPHAKGDKVMKDLLAADVSAYLELWLKAWYGKDFFAMPAETPIWVNLTTKKGEELGYNGVAGVCLDYLGTSKIHTTRHSFALLMQEAKAKLTDIQKRLGHANVSTTGRYMDALTSEYNEYAEKLSELVRPPKKKE